MEPLGDIAGLLQNLLGFGAIIIIAIVVLRPGGIKRFFLGKSGEDNLNDWLEARKKSRKSREEVNKVLLENGVTPEDLKNKK